MIRFFRPLLALAALPVLLSVSPAPEAQAQAMKTEDDKTLYTLGAVIGKNLAQFNLTKAEIELVKKGLTDQLNGAKLATDLEVYGPKIDVLRNKRGAEKAKGEKDKAKAYLAKSAKEAGVKQMPSGLLYKDLKVGTGTQPKPTDKVKVHYRGTLIDGTEFDSSYKRGEPTEFGLNGVIPCWTEGVGKMKTGGKSRLVCPSDIAYGDRGSPPTIPGGATLVFEVELLAVNGKP